MKEATQRLLELGLTDKEASIYLAMLELGPSSVQEIALKAGIIRTSAYDLLKELQQRGLVSSVEQGSRVVYTAESPKILQSFLERQGKELEERHRKMAESLPFFMALYNSLPDKPRVRYFEGPEGVIAIREILSAASGECACFTAIDESLIEHASHVDEPERQRLAKRMHGKYLISRKPGCEIPETDLRTWEVREIPYEVAPFKGEIDIIDDKVGVHVFSKTSSMGFVVESMDLADLFRALFAAAWKGATPVHL